MSRLVAILVLLFCTPALADGPAALRVLKDNCFSCHNAEKAKASLQLTSRDRILKGGDSGPAMVPGQPAKSLLFTLLAADGDPHMPPKKQLAAAEITAIEKWIAAGAPWDDSALTDAPTTRPIAFRDLPAGYAPVLALALSPDGKTLAAGRGRKVVLYDVAKPDRPAAHTFDGPRDAVQSLAWNADGSQLAAGEFGQVFVWQIADATKPPLVLKDFIGRVTALRFLPDGSLLVADGGTPVAARLSRLQLPDARPVQIAEKAHADSILAIAATADGKLIATAGGDKVIRLWNPADLAKPTGALEGHTGRVAAIAFNTDGTQLASGSADRDMKVWDVKTRERIKSVGPHQAALTALAWTPSKKIAVATEDGAVRLNPSDSSDLARPLSTPADDVLYSLAISPDGNTLYVGSHDGTVYVLTTAGKVIGKL